MRLSVIVPVYKVEKYIHRCIDSILAQTFADFELLLVDDGSPDNCGNICDTYAEKDNRVRVIHKVNGGVSAARNSALDVAKGDYIAFCDSDDYWDWVSESSQIDYDDFFGNLKYAKAEKEGYYMITFNLGLWNGNKIGYVGKIYDSLSEAIKDALNSSRDYWDYKIAFENGDVVVYGYHHDGTNIMTIKRLSKHGERNLLFKEEPNFEKYVEKKDTFKKLDWQFAWT